MLISGCASQLCMDKAELLPLVYTLSTYNSGSPYGYHALLQSLYSIEQRDAPP